MPLFVLADNEDDGFDLIKPSVIQQLRTILDQYPDDGQILKVWTVVMKRAMITFIHSPCLPLEKSVYFWQAKDIIQKFCVQSILQQNQRHM